MITHIKQGRIQDFQLGGGGGALKKNAPSGGRCEHFWGVSCEKSRFYTKNHILFQLRREARKYLGYFVWKITILRQKIIFFPILGGRAPGAAPPPPPLDPPLLKAYHYCVDRNSITVYLTYHIFRTILCLTSITSLSSKSSGRNCSVIFRYKSIWHAWHTGDDKM